MLLIFILRISLFTFTSAENLHNSQSKTTTFDSYSVLFQLHLALLLSYPLDVKQFPTYFLIFRFRQQNAFSFNPQRSLHHLLFLFNNHFRASNKCLSTVRREEIQFTQLTSSKSSAGKLWVVLIFSLCFHICFHIFLYPFDLPFVPRVISDSPKIQKKRKYSILPSRFHFCFLG